MVAPEADIFLSTVQRYISSKGIYDPAEGTPAWIFIELFRPSINSAIERAINYKNKMVQYTNTVLNNSSQTPSTDVGASYPPPSTEATPTENEEQAQAAQRNRVFISYSHKDKRFLDELLTHLKPLERAGRLSPWSDLQIQPGSKWIEDIQAALATTKVAVLLVTKDFLASDFIHQSELNPLLKAAEEGGVAIRWVLVRDCNWSKTRLKDYQAAYPLDKPLAAQGLHRDSAWVAICEEIEKAVDFHK
jgi:hypothetical protein